MDAKHFKILSQKWAHKLREDARDIEHEIIIFYLVRQSERKNMDVFQPGHEGALFELLKHKIRGNNLESVGGSGKRSTSSDDDDEPVFEIKDELIDFEEKAEQLEERTNFEEKFEKELDQLDQLNNLAGSDLGEACGFSGANGRLILAQLKKDIVESAKKRITSKPRASKPGARRRVKAQMTPELV